MTSSSDPHAGIPAVLAGSPLDRAELAVLLVHGRGGGGGDMLDLGRALLPEDTPPAALIAPQASQRGLHPRSWYPQSFMAPTQANQPGLDSGLRALDRALTTVFDAGLPADRIVLAGFSQGACLMLEYVVRHSRRFAGVAAFSGGLIGPPGSRWPGPHSADDHGLDSMPLFLGCSDCDPHIPLARVHESATAFEALGTTVEKRIYPGMPHTIIEDEVRWVQDLITGL